jgi:hypothetical protein
MRDAQLELVGDGGDPGVVISLEDLLGAGQIQVAWREGGGRVLVQIATVKESVQESQGQKLKESGAV